MNDNFNVTIAPLNNLSVRRKLSLVLYHGGAICKPAADLVCHFCSGLQRSRLLSSPRVLQRRSLGCSRTCKAGEHICPTKVSNSSSIMRRYCCRSILRVFCNIVDFANSRIAFASLSLVPSLRWSWHSGPSCSSQFSCSWTKRDSADDP